MSMKHITELLERAELHEEVVMVEQFVQQRAELLEALRKIKHSVDQYKVFGNDKKREIYLIEATCISAIAKAEATE